MCDTESTVFRPTFNHSVRIRASSDRLSADGGALLLRELLHRLGWVEWLSGRLHDPRDRARIVHPQPELFRTLLLLAAQGWTHLEDADHLGGDPILRCAVSSRRQDRPLQPARGPREPEALPSQPTLSRLLRALSTEANRETLNAALLEGADRRHGLRTRGPVEEAIVDLDSVPVEVHGHQPGSAYNGHYQVRCYHPLVLHWSLGDFLGARLRPGNAHTADGGLAFALPRLRWAKRRARRLWLRIDAGFPEPGLLQGVEAEGIRYVARIRTNDVLKRKAEPYLTRPPGRPPKEGRTWFHELRYGANTWERKRRVVLVVLERPDVTEAEDGTVQHRLLLDHFFLLTNASEEEVPAEELLERYRRRGRAEKDFGDWQQALETRLSSSPRPKARYRGRPLPETEPKRDSFAVNEAWLLTELLAANLLETARSLYERGCGARLERQRFRNRFLKAPVRITLGGRRIRVHADDRHVAAWNAILEALAETHPIRGSPAPRARSLPAA